MKKMLLTALAVLAAGSAAPAMAASILSADFESGYSGFTPTGNVAVISGADYVTFAGGSGSAAAQANHFVSFGAGNVAGSGLVSRGFTTVAGRTYTLSFDFGAFNQTGQTLFLNILGIGGTAVATTGGTSNLDALFGHYTASFTGNGASTLLSFSSTSNANDNADILLDNIDVSAVPEPASWALMILGFGVVGGAMRRRARVRTAIAYA